MRQRKTAPTTMGAASYYTLFLVNPKPVKRSGPESTSWLTPEQAQKTFASSFSLSFNSNGRIFSTSDFVSPYPQHFPSLLVNLWPKNSAPCQITSLLYSHKDDIGEKLPVHGSPPFWDPPWRNCHSWESIRLQTVCQTFLLLSIIIFWN